MEQWWATAVDAAAAIWWEVWWAAYCYTRNKHSRHRLTQHIDTARINHLDISHWSETDGLSDELHCQRKTANLKFYARHTVCVSLKSLNNMLDKLRHRI